MTRARVGVVIKTWEVIYRLLASSTARGIEAVYWLFLDGFDDSRKGGGLIDS